MSWNLAFGRTSYQLFVCATELVLSRAMAWLSSTLWALGFGHAQWVASALTPMGVAAAQRQGYLAARPLDGGHWGPE